MTTISSTLQINLVEDATKNAPRVAAALEKMQKEASALQAVLAKSGLSDKMQTDLKKLGASETHIRGLTLSWQDYAKAQGLAGKATADYTKAEAAVAKQFESVALPGIKALRKEEAALAKARHDQTVRSEQEAIRAAQHKAAEEKRLAEQEARDRRIVDQQVTRDAMREERARLRMLAQEERQVRRHAEHLAHERGRTDNTVAGVAALYAAHSAMHAAVKVGERYREFDKERRYAQVVMGASDDQMKPLVDQAIRGSANSKFNDVQWLAAQRNLAARGYNRDQVLGFTPTASHLGQAFDVSMEDGVKLFEGAMLGFKKDVSTETAAKRSAQRTADLEVKTSKISGAGADDLIAAYKRGAASARMAGLTEEQMLAFVGTAKKVNIGGEEAATAFVALTKNLLSPTRQARTAMHAAGIDFAKFQKVGPIDEAGFVSEVARTYSVKLSKSTQAHLHKIFSNPELMKDPDKLMPAVTRYLRGALGAKDAKSLSSITGLLSRYRDASMTGVDTQGLLSAIMAGMAKNPALANVVFGSKQGGRISAALDAEMFAHMLDELRNHSDGFAEKVSDARMAGFNGALDKLSNQMAILETSIGRAFDNDGRGGFLTSATEAVGQLVHVLGEANPRILRAGSEAVLLAGAFAALKSVDFLKGGFGLKASASALDLSAKLLDEAAIKLGATKGGVPVGGEPGAPAGESAIKVPSKGFFGEGGLKSVPKSLMVGGPAAVGEYLAYQFATGLIDQGLKATRDIFARDKDKQYRADKFNEQSIFQKFGFFGGSSDPMDPRFAPPKDTQAPKVPTDANAADDDESPPIAGKRASGGPVSRGKTYLVGEHGPELFTPGMNGAISTADVQRMLSRASFATHATTDGGETAKAVRAMAFDLASAVEGIARAVDRAAAKTTKVGGDFQGDTPFYSSEGSGGHPHSFGGGGRRGFMEQGHGSEGTGRKGFARRAAQGPGDDVPTDGDSVKTATALLKKREGFQPTAKWDRNHMRLGYGSDTITDADGHVREVKSGDHVSREDAERDLARRIPEFQRKIAREVGVESWKKLSPVVQGALTSMAYNYGGFSKLPSMRAAIGSGDNAKIAEAIRRREGDNGGINAARRAEEAQIVEHGGARAAMPVQPGGLAKMSGDGTIVDHLQHMRDAGMISDKQCVTLAMGAVGIRKGAGAGGNVHDWRAGDDADAGTLKPGTPVATFLDRNGRPTDRYAGGGAGTPGAHLDHAGVFENYLLDKTGKRIGFQMAEQYAKSRGVMEKKYYFRSGFGESDGSNYRAIKGPDGRYLGGTNNPMNGPTDDPLALRKKREEGHFALGGHLRALDGMAVSPDIDHSGIKEMIGHIRTARAELDKLHGAKGGRSGGTTNKVAGLGSRMRGGFASPGLTMG